MYNFDNNTWWVKNSMTRMCIHKQFYFIFENNGKKWIFCCDKYFHLNIPKIITVHDVFFFSTFENNEVLKKELQAFQWQPPTTQAKKNKVTSHLFSVYFQNILSIPLERSRVPLVGNKRIRKENKWRSTLQQNGENCVWRQKNWSYKSWTDSRSCPS